MNIVNAGSRYQVYGESVQTFKTLPVKSYNIGFSPMSGFFLTERPNLTTAGEKVYGECNKKIDKVIKSYKTMSHRNFGVLLSGPKGIGKSMFVRAIGERAIKEGLPVIVAEDFIPGIAGFLASIDQEVVVVFDEFEKKFKITDEVNPQDDMLSLFDGMDGGHKLFIATCNQTRDLSEYLINRPGRFHYHINISTPSKDEIEQYLKDNVSSEYSDVIEDAVKLCDLIGTPYDYLRAIAFELNQGYSLKEAMNDLNITKGERTVFRVMAYRQDGKIFTSHYENFDITSKSYYWFHAGLYNERTRKYEDVSLRVIPSHAKLIDGEYVIEQLVKGENEYDYDDFLAEAGGDEKLAQKLANEANAKNVFTKIVFKRAAVRDYGKYMQEDV